MKIKFLRKILKSLKENIIICPENVSINDLIKNIDFVVTVENDWHGGGI